MTCNLISRGEVMKKFSILGISLVDLSAREGLRQAERFLHNGALNTATYITAKTLTSAAGSQELKELLEDTDLTICVEPDILEAAGIASAGRVREIEERIFLREFLRRLARQKERICILADTKQQAEAFADSLLEQQGNLNIAECKGYDEFEQQKERMMNSLNEVAPDVIFSRMTWPLDLELMNSGRKFLNAELWMALPEVKLPKRARHDVFSGIRKKLFWKKVKNYNQEKAEEPKEESNGHIIS